MKFKTMTPKHTQRQAFSERRKFYDATIIIVTLGITANFNESQAYSKSMQIIVRTNILPNTSSNNDPCPSFPEVF